MTNRPTNPLVHLELRTCNLPRACLFYTEMFEWRAEPLKVGSRSYLSLHLGGIVDGGVVEEESERARWLPYIEVADIVEATELARSLGAAVVLEPHEGPAGWRSIISAPALAEVALWQSKASPGTR